MHTLVMKFQITLHMHRPIPLINLTEVVMFILLLVLGNFVFEAKVTLF
jgi:hypothetical protein